MPTIIKSPEEVRRQAASHTTPEPLRPQKTANFHVWWVASMVALAIVIFTIASFQWSQRPPSDGALYEDDVVSPPAKAEQSSIEYIEAQSARFDAAYKSIPRNLVMYHYFSAVERCIRGEKIFCQHDDIESSFDVESAGSPLQTGDELQKHFTEGGWRVGSYEVQLKGSRKDIPRSAIKDASQVVDSITLSFTFTDSKGTVCAKARMYSDSKEKWLASIFDCNQKAKAEGDLT